MLEKFAGKKISSIPNSREQILFYSYPAIKHGSKKYVFVNFADGHAKSLTLKEFELARKNDYLYKAPDEQ